MSLAETLASLQMSNEERELREVLAGMQLRQGALEMYVGQCDFTRDRLAQTAVIGAIEMPYFPSDPVAVKTALMERSAS